MSQTKTILIIEDEIPILNILSNKLTREGFTVLTAKDGKQGLELALAKHPALILLDIILPVMDGITMLKKLHADPWGKNAQVVMLTNLGDSQSVANALELGSHDFLVKADWTIEDVVQIARDKLKG
jgi:DNA-binding response OmpR family regulator